jgi:hypothetical protein
LALLVVSLFFFEMKHSSGRMSFKMKPTSFRTNVF